MFILFCIIISCGKSVSYLIYTCINFCPNFHGNSYKKSASSHKTQIILLDFWCCVSTPRKLWGFLERLRMDASLAFKKYLVFFDLCLEVLLTLSNFPQLSCSKTSRMSALHEPFLLFPILLRAYHFIRVSQIKVSRTYQCFSWQLPNLSKFWRVNA